MISKETKKSHEAKKVLMIGKNEQKKREEIKYEEMNRKKLKQRKEKIISFFY